MNKTKKTYWSIGKSLLIFVGFFFCLLTFQTKPALAEPKNAYKYQPVATDVPIQNGSYLSMNFSAYVDDSVVINQVRSVFEIRIGSSTGPALVDGAAGQGPLVPAVNLSEAGMGFTSWSVSAIQVNNLVSGTTYYYRVKTMNNLGEEKTVNPWSPWWQMTPVSGGISLSDMPVISPVGIEATSTYRGGDIYVHFKYDNTWAGLAGYRLERIIKGQTWDTALATNFTSNNYLQPATSSPDSFLGGVSCSAGCFRVLDPNLKAIGTTYVYRVRMFVNNAGVITAGPPSSLVEVVAPDFLPLPQFDQQANIVYPYPTYIYIQLFLGGPGSIGQWTPLSQVNGVNDIANGGYTVDRSTDGINWSWLQDNYAGSGLLLGNSSYPSPFDTICPNSSAAYTCRTNYDVAADQNTTYWYRARTYVVPNKVTGVRIYGAPFVVGPIITPSFTPVGKPTYIGLEATSTTISSNVNLIFYKNWNDEDFWYVDYFQIQESVNNGPYSSFNSPNPSMGVNFRVWDDYSESYPGEIYSTTTPKQGEICPDTGECFLATNLRTPGNYYKYRVRFCADAVCGDWVETPGSIQALDYLPLALNLNPPQSVYFNDASSGYNLADLRLNYDPFQSAITDNIRLVPGYASYSANGYEINAPDLTWQSTSTQIEVSRDGLGNSFQPAGLQTSQFINTSNPAVSLTIQNGDAPPYYVPINYNYTCYNNMPNKQSLCQPGTFNYNLTVSSTASYKLRIKSSNSEDRLNPVKDISNVITNSPENVCSKLGVQHHLTVYLTTGYGYYSFFRYNSTPDMVKGVICPDATAKSNPVWSEVELGVLQANKPYALGINWNNDWSQNPSGTWNGPEDFDSNVLLQQVQVVPSQNSTSTLVNGDNFVFGRDPTQFIAKTADNQSISSSLLYLDPDKPNYVRARSINRYVPDYHPLRFSAWATSSAIALAKPAPAVALTATDGSLLGSVNLNLNYDYAISGPVLFEGSYKLAASSSWIGLPDLTCLAGNCQVVLKDLIPGRTYNFQARPKTSNVAASWLVANFTLAAMPVVNQFELRTSILGGKSTVSIYFNLNNTWNVTALDGYLIERQVGTSTWSQFSKKDFVVFPSTSTDASTVLGTNCSVDRSCYLVKDQTVILATQYGYRVSLIYHLASSTELIGQPSTVKTILSADYVGLAINPPAVVGVIATTSGSNLVMPSLDYSGSFQSTLPQTINSYFPSFNYNGYEVNDWSSGLSQLQYGNSTTTWTATGYKLNRYAVTPTSGYSTSTLVTSTNLTLGDQPTNFSPNQYLYLDFSKGDYYFRARSINPYILYANNPNKTSAWTVSAKISQSQLKPFPMVIRNFQATSTNIANTVELDFNYKFDVSGPTAFELQASLTKDGPWLAHTEANINCYTATSTKYVTFISSLLPGQTYYFRIRPRGSSLGWTYTGGNIIQLSSNCTSIVFATGSISTSSPISVSQINEIRTAVNDCYTSLSAPPMSFENTTNNVSTLVGGSVIRAVHIQQLREAVQLIYERLKVGYPLDPKWQIDWPTVWMPDPVITPNVTYIKPAHFQQIRDLLSAIGL